MRVAALVGAVALALAAAPAAPAATLPGLHNARYCEVLELKGDFPDAAVTVWNTIGLNSCPAAWWNGLDAGELARERGAMVVVLNGPRHFLMDSVTATPGRVRSWHGVRMRRVATIPIHSAAELARTPYTDRVVKRRNTWTWNRGRLVYELVAPGGDVYVMQAYAQIVDPEQRIGQLRSLSSRLDLPLGWRYRVRRLRNELAVRPIKGNATIVQDELQNTYQLFKSTRRPGPRKRRAVKLSGATRTVTADTPGTIQDEGSVTSKPFGRGSVKLVGTLADDRFSGTFRLLFKKGSIFGTATMPFTIQGNEIDFRGTVSFTGGTGAYRGISSGKLQAHDTNTLDGQNGVISLEGFATY